MNVSTDSSESGVLDTIKLLLAAFTLVGGLYGYYYYLEVSLPLRVLMVLAYSNRAPIQSLRTRNNIVVIALLLQKL